MQKRESIFKTAKKHLLSHPILLLFGVIAAIGGAVNVFGIGINSAVRVLLLDTGLHIIGASFLQRIIAILLGSLLSFVIILAISGFAQAILLKVAGSHFHQEEDLWYGALRRGIKSAIPLAKIWFLFYVASTLFVAGIYRLVLVAATAVNSTVGAIVILALALIGIIFLLLLFGAIAMNASCFVSIFRMKAGKSVASGFDLFAQIPMKSIGILALICLIWIISITILAAASFAVLFIIIWVAHLTVSTEQLTNLIKNGINQALLITMLLGILFVTNAVLTAFADTVWALFFLEHVSTAQLPKKLAEHSAIRSAMAEAETV